MPQTSKGANPCFAFFAAHVYDKKDMTLDRQTAVPLIHDAPGEVCKAEVRGQPRIKGFRVVFAPLVRNCKDDIYHTARPT